jgi:hypothetical protein
MAPYVYRLYGTSKPCDIFKTQDEYNSMLKWILTIPLDNPIVQESQKYQMWRQMTAYVVINWANPKQYRSMRDFVKDIKQYVAEENSEVSAIYKKSSWFNNMFKYSFWEGYNYIMWIPMMIVRHKK